MTSQKEAWSPVQGPIWSQTLGVYDKPVMEIWPGRRGPQKPQPRLSNPASDSHFILTGSAQVLGQVVARNKLQLLQGALALEGWPSGQCAATPTGIGHPSWLRRAVKGMVMVGMQA